MSWPPKSVSNLREETAGWQLEKIIGGDFHFDYDHTRSIDMIGCIGYPPKGKPIVCIEYKHDLHTNREHKEKAILEVVSTFLVGVYYEDDGDNYPLDFGFILGPDGGYWISKRTSQIGSIRLTYLQIAERIKDRILREYLRAATKTSFSEGNPR